MIQFEYVSPNSVKQALGLLSANWGDTEVLAGGTDLLGLMKDFVLTPKRVVNIKQVSGLEAIRTERDGGVRIGALVTLDRIIEASHIRQNYPALAQPSQTPPVRKSGTWLPSAATSANIHAAGISATEWACCQRRRMGSPW